MNICRSLFFASAFVFFLLCTVSQAQVAGIQAGPSASTPAGGFGPAVASGPAIASGPAVAGGPADGPALAAGPTDKCKLDVCFVVDQSCSMPKNAAVTFVRNVLNEILKDSNTVAHFSAFGFLETSELSRKRTSNKATFFQSLNADVGNEFKSFQDAFRACIDEVKGNKQNIFVISDGFKTLPAPAFAAGAQAKQPKLEFNLFSIAVGNPANEQYLKGLASKPQYYSKVSASQLRASTLAQKFVKFFRCSRTCPMDHVCFALDQSGSISTTDWSRQKNFVTDIAVEIVSPFVVTKLSAIKFDSGVQQIVSTPSLGVFTAQVLTATPNKGGTFINLGLKTCYDLVKSGKGKRSIVLLTDGYSGAAPIANQIKQDGISLVAVGIGNNVNVNYLKGIASDPDSEFYIPADFANLEEKVAAVAETTCVTPTPGSPIAFAMPGAAPGAPGASALEAPEPAAFCGEGENC